MKLTPRFARRLACGIVALAATAGEPVSAAGRRDIAGIGLGMTAEQIVKAARVTCRINRARDVSCVDPEDASEYKALMSGGKPSVALSVKHTFCSPKTVAVVLGALLRAYRVAPARSRPNPNGASFTIEDGVEGNLNASGGSCPRGGRSYQFSLHDNALFQMNTGSGPDATAR